MLVAFDIVRSYLCEIEEKIMSNLIWRYSFETRINLLVTPDGLCHEPKNWKNMGSTFSICSQNEKWILKVESISVNANRYLLYSNIDFCVYTKI